MVLPKWLDVTKQQNWRNQSAWWQPESMFSTRLQSGMSSWILRRSKRLRMSRWLVIFSAKFVTIIGFQLCNFYREGHLCDKCIVLGGCLHGGCKTALECDCDLGSNQSLRGKYTGTHCDIRKFFSSLEMSHLNFWHFLAIFVLLKVTCLVTLFYCKLQVFQKLAKMDLFGIFN